MTETLTGSATPGAGRSLIELEAMRRVSGVVNDRRSGRPLAGGVSVSLSGGADGTFSATTDVAGRYRIAVPEGRYMASVVRAGLLPLFQGEEGPRDEEALDLRRTTTLRRDFGLAASRYVAGRVVDEKQQPLPGAFLTLSPRQQPRLYSLGGVGHATGSAS